MTAAAADSVDCGADALPLQNPPPSSSWTVTCWIPDDLVPFYLHDFTKNRLT